MIFGDKTFQAKAFKTCYYIRMAVNSIYDNCKFKHTICMILHSRKPCKLNDKQLQKPTNIYTHMA